MAGWVTHLRVADAMITHANFKVNAEKYYIGTIATDCGEVLFGENGKKYYNPPRYISHWTDNISDWDATIHFEKFYDLYLKDEVDNDKKSFYLGYFAHLITDALWMEIIVRPVKVRFQTNEEYQQIAKKRFRAEWYYTEIAFLKNNPNYYPLELATSVKDFHNMYLEYASEDEIKEKLETLSKCYNVLDLNENIKYEYLSPVQYEEVMVTICNLAKMILSAR